LTEQAQTARAHQTNAGQDDEQAAAPTAGPRSEGPLGVVVAAAAEQRPATAAAKSKAHTAFSFWSLMDNLAAPRAADNDFRTFCYFAMRPSL
jgi:hypothetical protein